ncbi:Qat anti-phage system associated protein QatB [Heliomicrobium modesticaldum]|uniref:Qat anti-phage system associated protein QatB n=1 Tax=Heliomicrobium modesticaldum TaxID=35701 RepID=UPI002FFBE9C1
MGKPIDQIFLGLVDYICPDGGRTDEGIARNAFIDLLPLIKEMGIEENSGINETQLRAIMEVYFSNVIMQRLINDIGKNTFRLPDDIDEINFIESQLSEFIKGTVSDAITGLGIDFQEISDERAREVVDGVYLTAYTILENLAEEGEE